MGYTLKRGLMYRMPTHFGPACGPRQGPERRNQFLNQEAKSETRVVAISFLTNPEQLEELIPEGVGLKLDREPVVTISVTYMKGLLWLAGRGYNMLGVTFPVIFKGKKDLVKGSFLTVLWENLTDAIVTGREELGSPKVYAEIPEPRLYPKMVHCTAGWLGFKFIDLTVGNLTPLPSRELKAATGLRGSGDGLIWYKYIPKTGLWGTAEASYVTLTPMKSGGPPTRQEGWKGEGKVQFHRATWEDMPTEHMIVNAFCDLVIKEYRGAYVLKTEGGKVDDLSDTCVLE
jgi:hypothetical protein